jgi:DNA-binding GntR family transcriptional regulator
MARTPNASPLAEQVFETLRSDLLDGRIQPGERLKLPALTGRFGVSLTVIREALTRLAEQGLVTANPKRGFSVMTLSADNLVDLTYVRVQLETLTLRASIERGGLDWETGVVGRLYALGRTPQLCDDGTFNAEWFLSHRAFHESLLAGCGSPRLLAITAAERDRAELYRAWSLSLAADTQRRVRAEHKKIADLALARDADGAAAALTAHIERTTTALLDYASKRSEKLSINGSSFTRN